jgi:hypothetical protein
MSFELVFLTLGRVEGRWYSGFQGVKVLVFGIEFLVSGLAVNVESETLILTGIFLYVSFLPPQCKANKRIVCHSSSLSFLGI